MFTACPLRGLLRPRMRSARGFFYRKIPVWGNASFAKKIAGFERVWNLETQGFTKEGFFKIFESRFLRNSSLGLLLELAAGDGLVGSMGVWMEAMGSNWRVKAWEYRPLVFQSLRKNRPHTPIFLGKLLHYHHEPGVADVAITARSSQEASAVCRWIRQKIIQPSWLGIWNPSRRAVWYQRLCREGYRLELVWHNMEFYRRKSL